MSDTEIIKSVLAGNTNDYRKIVEKYQHKIFRTCMGYVHNEDDANDLAQDTFVNAFQNLHRFKFQSAFSTWLVRIAINASLNFIRKNKKAFFESLEGGDGSFSLKDTLLLSDFSNPEEIFINDQCLNIVQGAMHELSDKQKTAFILSKYENMPQKEIAAIMKITEGAVESLIQRAKANLQKKLSPYLKKN